MRSAPAPLDYERPRPDEQLTASERFLELMRKRRSVRQLSAEAVPFELVENAVATAGTAPSGAHQQPWTESVGIAVGLLLASLHAAGLVTLTHTPSPMKFLSELLDRPENERAFCLIPVGYPAADATVPDLERKPLGEILVRV